MNGDPIGSEAPRGKSLEKRMGRYDGGFTPSEQRLKNQLMKQFMKHGGEGPGGNSAAYQEGWERTFGKKPSQWADLDKAHTKLMRELADEWFSSLNRDPYRANYDRIDWSK